jgi:ketosteroid isomerase-like protein
MPDGPTTTRSLQDQLDDVRRDLAELRGQLAELRDQEAIRRVLDSYAFLLDSSRWRDIPTAVFTDDAVDHHSPAAGVEPRGRAEIAQFLDTTMGALAGSQHLLGNSTITVDGDSATSRTYAACAHWRTAGPDPLPSDFTVAVAYDDTWRRTPAGWRICERHVHTFGPHGLLTGSRAPGLPRLGADLYGARDREDATGRTS